MVMISATDTVIGKLQNQTQPTIVFSDLDGTLFSSNWRILSAPFYNFQLQKYLQDNSLPFIVVTGRSDWTNIDKQQLRLLGLPSPDAVITANGTIIYYKTRTSYIRDFDWEAKMHYTKVKWENGSVETWNKLAITNRLKEYLLSKQIPYTLGQGNTFLIRIKIRRVSTPSLDVIRKEIVSLFPAGIRVMYTEKLLWENTKDIFSGDILVTPKSAGKDQAVKYLLEKYSKEYAVCHPELVSGSPTNWIPGQARDDKLHAFIFGDALVDVGMLCLSNTSLYSLEQYAINPTPLLQKAVHLAQKTIDHVHMYFGNSPELVLKIVKGEFYSSNEVRSKFSQSSNNTPSVIAGNEMTKQFPFSPAQNNPIRKVVRKFEPLLDKLVDKNLSPNEVSFLGLSKLSEGLNQLHNPKSSAIERLKGIYNYSFGNLTDVLDGVRARQRLFVISKQVEKSPHIQNTKYKILNTTAIPGQLVDGFSDRVKEFMQLYMRARKRNEQQSLNTLLAALSCTLPSIARAQVEITGKAVAERDAQGGSMIDRTKKLFMSLFMDTIGVHRKSYLIDQEMYAANIATFKHRLSVISSPRERSPLVIASNAKQSALSEFETKALERWLLYIDVLQQEDAIIKKYLAKHPTLLKQYEKESQKLAKEYLDLPVNKLRKKWKIKDYKLQIKNFIYSL